MKKYPALRPILLFLSVPVLLALAFQLFVTITMSSFDLHLDFSLKGRINDFLGIEEPRAPSLAAPMMLMLLGAFISVGTLIIRQFIGEHRRVRDMLTPQWIDRSSTMQVILGLAAAALLAMIGVCLDQVPYDSFLPYALSGMLVLRLAVYGVQRVLRKK